MARNLSVTLKSLATAFVLFDPASSHGEHASVLRPANPVVKKPIASNIRSRARVAIVERTLKHFAITLLLVAIAYPFELHGQTVRPSTLEELAVYNGPDRVQLLVNGAKKEGKVVWYTAMAGGSYKDLARAFEAKYGIAVEAYRGASRDLIAKMLAETQAKKYLMDIVESSPPLLMLMRAMNRLTPFSLPHLAKFAPDAKEEAGKNTVYWATDRESYMGFAYNKNKLTAATVPKNYDGLLNPALKGRMAFVTTDTGSRTIGAMVRIKGEEFVKKLRGQDLTMHSVSAQALNDMIISGEVEASPTIFRNHALVAAAKGRPWPGCRWTSCRRARAARVYLLRHRIVTARCCFLIFCSLQKDKKFSRITITAALSKNTASNDGTSRKACPLNSSNVKAIAGKNC